jgi:hypothetical protein
VEGVIEPCIGLFEEGLVNFIELYFHTIYVVDAELQDDRLVVLSPLATTLHGELSTDLVTVLHPILH